jgi:hypothetical protein
LAVAIGSQLLGILTTENIADHLALHAALRREPQVLPEPQAGCVPPKIEQPVPGSMYP